MNSFRDKQQKPYRFRSETSGTPGYQKVAKNKHHIFESQGPTGKTRGNSVQLVEKYLSLGREAFALGDSVLSEYFFEYVEHYQRTSHDLNCFKSEEASASLNGDPKKRDPLQGDGIKEHIHVAKDQAQLSKDLPPSATEPNHVPKEHTPISTEHSPLFKDQCHTGEDTVKKPPRNYRRRPLRSGEAREKNATGGIILPVSVSEDEC